MSIRHKHLVEWTAAQGGRRQVRFGAAGRTAVGPRTSGVFAAAARFVERATRRHGA